MDGFRRKWIRFQSGAIITRGMMEELYSYPRDVVSAYSRQLSYGILTGLYFYAKDGKVWLGSGLIRFQDEIFRLYEDVCLTDLIESDKKIKGGEYLNLVLQPDRSETPLEGVFQENLKFVIRPEKGDNREAFQLCGFYGGLPSILPNPAAEAPEREYSLDSRFDILDTPWAAKREATFHPLVFEAFARSLALATEKTALEYAMILELQAHGVLPMETLRFYIAEMLGQLSDLANRREIFKVACQLARGKKPGSAPMTEHRRAPEQKKLIEPPVFWNNFNPED